MGTTAIALIGLVLWSVLLSFLLVGARASKLLKNEKELNSFQPDGKDLDESGLRITRAHANSMEWLILGASIMLLAIATGNTAITDGLAMYFLYARIAQSVVHIISTSNLMVAARATFFSIQLIFIMIWAIDLLQLL